MNQLKFAGFAFLMVSLAACSGVSKRVVIMSSGTVTIDQGNKLIKLEPGTQHNEEVMNLSGGDSTTITVETVDGKNTFQVGKGLSVLNLKSQDTLVGGLVNYGASAARERVSDQELSHLIDSTRKLILGMGASDETKTYYILPFTLKKITDDINSKVIGPFQGIPYKLDKVNGKVPEVYKLYTNKQQRESLLDLFRRMK